MNNQYDYMYERGRALSQSSQNTTHYGSIDSCINSSSDDHHQIDIKQKQTTTIKSSSSVNNNNLNNNMYYYSTNSNSKQEEGKQKQSSTTILSSIESIILTVGLTMNFGSIIRFPYMVHQFEGGAFLIPYMTLLIIVGAPLIILDVSLGSIARQSIVFALGRWNRRASGVGMAAIVFGSLIIASYYSVMTSWIAVYFGYIFKEVFPWSNNPETFFHDEILHLSAHSFDISGFLSWPVLITLIVFWFICYWLVFARFINRFARILLSLASLSYFVVLIVVLIRVSLELGSTAGMLQFFRPNWNLLYRGDLWLGAFGQCCFTYGIANGALIIHTSYYYSSSSNKKEEDKKNKLDTVLLSWTIVLFGFLFSIVSGLTYYASLGFLSSAARGTTTTNEINSLLAPPEIASPIFIMIQVVSQLFPLPQAFIFMLLLSMIAVGFNSVLLLVESLIDIVKNHIPRRNTRRIIVSIIVVCLIGVIGILFTLSNGYYIVEIVDHYVGNYGMGMIAMMECIMIGWFSSNQDGGINRKKKKLLRRNRPLTYWFSLCQHFGKRWREFKSERSWNNFKHFFFFSIEHVRDRFSKESLFGPYLWWSLSIKYITPLLLFSLVVWNIVTECIQPFSTNHHRNSSVAMDSDATVPEYDILSLVLGWMLVVSCLFVFVIFGVWPSVAEKDEIGGDGGVKELENLGDSSFRQPLYTSYSDFSEISNVDLDTQD